MNRTLTMPKCPYCGKSMKYIVENYDTIQSIKVKLVTDTNGNNITIDCSNCGKSYKVTCDVRFYK